MDIPGRIGLLDQIMQDIPGVEERWLAASMAAKESQPESYQAAVDWYSITVIYRYIRFVRKAFQNILQYGKPKIPGKVSTRANGQVVAQVVPHDWKEASALPGVRRSLDGSIRFFARWRHSPGNLLSEQRSQRTGLCCAWRREHRCVSVRRFYAQDYYRRAGGCPEDEPC